VLRDIAWADYQRLLELRGEGSVPRLTYLDGELELMTPSVDHEGLKTRLRRLIEAYAELCGIPLEGFGSWTLRSELQRRGVEADECYAIGPLSGTPEIPDFAIEVIWTRGGIDKLEVYRGLGVREVWIWQGRQLRIYTLDNDAYRTVARSCFLPGLDPRLIVECMDAPSQTEAVALLRSRGKS
jgi:Uma2 family endonuclease